MNNFKFITKQDTLDALFFQLPKSLMYEPEYKELSANAKILYSFLLDRTALSIENDWFDKEDRAYIICEIDEVEIFLNCARNTANKCMKELEQFGLIMKQRQGQGKANLLYVAKVEAKKNTLSSHLKFHKRLVSTLKNKRKQEKEIREFLKFKKCTSVGNTKVEENKSMNPCNFNRSTKNELLRVQNLDGSNNEFKDTENVVVVNQEKQDKISIVKKYFTINDLQEKLIRTMNTDILKDAIEYTVAQCGNTFAYVYKVYKSLLEKKKAPSTAVTVKSASDTFIKNCTNSIPQFKPKYKSNKFNDGTNNNFVKYGDDLERLLVEKQKSKFGNSSICVAL